jgi:hypothetical protein
MASFGEVLKEFKGNEEAENLVAMISDPELQSGMIAWKSVVIRFKGASDCEDKDPASKWNWMWDQIDYNESQFGVVAGIKVSYEVGKLIERLKGFRLIYPDGTVNNLAKQYLQTIILQKLKQSMKKMPKSNNPA